MSIARRAAFAAICPALAMLATALLAVFPGARAQAEPPGGVSAYTPRPTPDPAPPAAAPSRRRTRPPRSSA